MRFKYSDDEIKGILNKMVVIFDTREQANDHIVDWFIKNKHPYKEEMIPYGDYSCYLPVGSFEGQLRDIYFTDEIVLERKFCIDELAMNFKDHKININEVTQEIIDLLGEKYLKKVLKTDYNRLKSELAHLNKYDIQFFILMEDKNYDENIRLGRFRAKYDKETLYKRTKALEREFRTMIRPTDKSVMGSEIYNTLKYEVRNILKNKGFIEMEGEESE